MSISGPPWVVELSAGGIPRWSADATALLKPDGTVAGVPYVLTPPAARDIDGKQSKGHIGCYGAARILER